MNIKYYCTNCLSLLKQDDYCEACGKTIDPQHSQLINRENFPGLYKWYGLLGAPLLGFLSYFIVYTFFTGDLQMKKMGAALFFIVPLCTGAMSGYFMRPIKHLFKRIIISVLSACALAGLVLISKSSGLACATVLVTIFILPLFIGLIFGRLFRLYCARHLSAQFQSSPVLILFFVPIIYGAVEEKYFTKTPLRTVQTQMTINASPAQTWHKIRFYEHVNQPVPFVVKLGLPIPKRAVGNHKKVGEITSCEYETGGFINKKITRLTENKELSFKVIKQNIHFEHDLKLHGGSIYLSPINNGRHTLITMKTHYETFVRPSWLWEPSMDYVIKALHQYVIKDMQNALVSLNTG